MAKGSVIRRGKLRYALVLELGADSETGKRRQKWIKFRGTKADAEKELTRLMAEVGTGEYIPPTPEKLVDALEYWIENVIAPSRAARTAVVYRGIVRNHIAPALGVLPLAEIGPVQLDAYYNARRAEGLSEKTLEVHHCVISGFYRWAVRKAMARRNPASLVDRRPRARTADAAPKSWDRDEARRFTAHLRETDAQTRALYLLSLESGMRVGEVLGLRWANVDLEARVVRVVEQLVNRRPDAPEWAPPKRGRTRTISISAGVASELRAHRAEQNGLRMRNRGYYRDWGLAFARTWAERNRAADRPGDPLPATYPNTLLGRLCAEAGVPRLTFHGLRHTSATLSLLAGVPPKTVSDRLGHASIAITLDIYSRTLPEMDADAADRLGAILDAR